MLKPAISVIKRLGFKPIDLAVPVALAGVAAVSELAVMAMLIPVVAMIFDGTVPADGRLKVLGSLEIQIPVAVMSLGKQWTIAIVLACLLVIMLLRTASEACSYIALVHRIQEVVSQTRQRVFERFMTFGKGYLDEIGVSRVSSILMVKCSELSMYGVAARSAIVQAGFLVAYAFLLVSISWKLTLFSIALFPVYRLTSRHVSQRIYRVSEKYSRALSTFSDMVTNTTESFLLIKSYGVETREAKRFAEISTTLSRNTAAIEREISLFSAIQELLMPILVVVMMVTLTVASFMRDDGGAKSLVFFLALRRAANAVTSIVTILAQISRGGPALDEIDEMIKGMQRFAVPSGAEPCPPLAHSLEIKNLTFAYGNGSAALRGVSFSIPKGQTTAIVGRNGSGKSTILNLLQRLYDTEPGTILVDGKDIRSFELHSLRERFGVVSQDCVVRAETLRENMLIGAKNPANVTDAELTDALRRVKLDGFFSRLDRGFETPLAARGAGLSGGERQRLSIARAILRNPEILLLDEATSALDHETEEVVRVALEELTAGRTCIVIAHRMASIVNAHNIVVLERGLVVEQGTYSELSGRGHYLASNLPSMTAETDRVS